jgi:Bacterial SH3 domain
MHISLTRSVSNRMGGIRRHLDLRSRLSHGDRSGRLSTAIENPASKGLAQLKLGPASNIVSPRVTRFLKTEANCCVTHVSADTKNHLPRGEEATEARIPQALVPRTHAVATSINQQFADQRRLSPLLVFSSGVRTLVAGLILLALLPNLTLGAIFYLGVMNMPWSRPATHPSNESSVSGAQSVVPPPVLSAPTALEAAAGADVTFPIALDGTDGVPARSIIAIKGLPHGSALSSGRPYDETEWNLKTDEIGDLHLVLPSTAGGEAKLIIQLVAPNGAIIADTSTVLAITANSTTNIGTYGSKPELAKTQVWDGPAQEPGVTVGGERLANLDAATATSRDPVPLPTRRPTQTANDDVDANWIKPLDSVNLRERPTRSALAIGVVEKGAKLRVTGRKHRWVQVTNPATSEKGWIYAGKIATVR